MARSQSQLQLNLEELMKDINEDWEKYVFFQPPTVLPTPCIKYERDSSYVSHADNLKFFFLKRYQVTVIDRDPDSLIPDAVEALPHCRFDRFFIANGLNHWVYNLYF